MDKELVKKAKEAKTVEELKALAEENNFDMDEDKAEKYFAYLRSDGALGDDELDDISGGCGKRDTNYAIRECPNCHAWVKLSSREAELSVWTCSSCGAVMVSR